MTNAALVALTDPAQHPQAAQARLSETAASLLGESLSARAGLYAGLLARLAAVANRAGPLLALAVDQSASEAQLAGLANAERVLRAAESLWNEVANRATRRERIHAMRWAQQTRQGWADVALVRREFAATVYLGLDWVTAQTAAPVRILPGAEAALLTLNQDPLIMGATWDLSDLATTMTRWVVVT
jgi:hypothetical protein